jgi:hypothetical protein
VEAIVTFTVVAAGKWALGRSLLRSAAAVGGAVRTAGVCFDVHVAPRVVRDNLRIALLRWIADSVDPLPLAGHVVEANRRVTIAVRAIRGTTTAVSRGATESVLAVSAHAVTVLVAALAVEDVWDTTAVAVVAIETVRVRITSDLT